MDIIQNLSAQVIFADGIRIKPAIPTEVPNYEELCKKYPAIKEKFDNGKIVLLPAEQAKQVAEEINQEIEQAVEQAKKKKKAE